MKKLYLLLLLNSPFAYTQAIFVDRNGSCNNLIPCYNDIQLAVNNAHVNDVIHVFPGNYSENINLSQMGTELAAPEEGNISFITINQNGAPTPGTVTVSPISGSAFLHSNLIFNGDLTIDGFNVISVDDDGIDLDSIIGDITINNVTANNNFKDGIDLEVSSTNQTISIKNSIANSNGNRGLNIDGGDGTVVIIENTTANQNIEEGIDIESFEYDEIFEIQITNTHTSNNGFEAERSDGVKVWTEGKLVVNNLTSIDNEGSGIFIVDLSETLIQNSTFTGNGIFLGPVQQWDGISAFVAGTLDIINVTSNSNGSSGLYIERSTKGLDLNELNVTCSNLSSNIDGIRLYSDLSPSANYSINSTNINANSRYGIWSELDHINIQAQQNWW